jgi:hypothetical protein
MGHRHSGRHHWRASLEELHPGGEIHHGFGHRRARRFSRHGDQGEEIELTASPTTEVSDRPLAGIGNDEAVRIFTCVGRACRDAQGGQALLDALHREIGLAGPAAARIDVKSCGCLDQCKKGPVVVAYRGKAAQSSRPPHGLWSELTNRPLGTFLRATPGEARRIVERLVRK